MHVTAERNLPWLVLGWLERASTGTRKTETACHPKQVRKMAYVPPSRRSNFDETKSRGYNSAPPPPASGDGGYSGGGGGGGSYQSYGGGSYSGGGGGSSYSGGQRGDANPCKLFVGGLAWGTDDRALTDVFERFGRLVDVKVMMERDDPTRSRGFGFVTFEDEGAATAAAQQTDGTAVDGRQIRVNRADSGVRTIVSPSFHLLSITLPQMLLLRPVS
eukprot:SAG22_NODE_23_length_31399_cov_35.631313_27_plen_217_part_00